MYKMIISDLDYPIKINYKLYQIDSINLDHDKSKIFTNRPLIISRDITDKFVHETLLTSDLNKKFVLNAKFSNIVATLDEIVEKNISFLHNLISYASFLASLVNFIIIDATKCIIY